MDNDGDKIKHSRFPTDFMKDVFIKLNLFDNPERDIHQDFINYEMKHDLFREAYDRISSIEYQLLGKDEEWFKLKLIEPCTDADEDSWTENIYKSKYHDKEIDDMIHCEKWTLNIADQREETYKLRFFQSKLDRFYFIVYPPTFKQFLYHAYYNLRR